MIMIRIWNNYIYYNYNKDGKDEEEHIVNKLVQSTGRKSKKVTLKKKYMIEKKVRAHKKKQKKLQRKQPELFKSKSCLFHSFFSFSFFNSCQKQVKTSEI